VPCFEAHTFVHTVKEMIEMAQSRGGGRRGGGAGRGGGQGPGRMGGSKAAGPGGTCICLSCGHRKPHTVGVPCYREKCPKCGMRMTRG
jgi:hypothetical protein